MSTQIGRAWRPIPGEAGVVLDIKKGTEAADLALSIWSAVADCATAKKKF